MSTSRVFLAAAALVLWVAGPAVAQVTGSISGIVVDQNGAAIAAATVKVSGDTLPAGRTTTTSSTGQYGFTLLPPGTYKVEVRKEGVGESSRQTVVEVDRNSTIDLVIGLKVQESVEVTATAPAIDLKSTEVDTNFSATTMALLPLPRSYAGMFQLIPGVADNRSSIGPAAGGSRQDNMYLLDGVNITNPGFGYLSSEVNQLDIQEVNIKRAGVSAEFGRTAGVVTNAVSRSGGNRISGVGRVDWQPNALIGEFRSAAFRDSSVVPFVTPAVGVGGPFIQNSLFWYGSARYFSATLGQGRTNKLGTPLPDSIQSGHELYGKITWNIGTRQIVNVGYRDRPNTSSNTGLGSGTAPTVGTDTDNSSRIATVTWGFFPANRTTVDVRYLYMKENNVDTPLTDLGYLPTWNPMNLAAMGYYTDPKQQNVVFGGAEYTNTQNYRRHEVRGTFTQFFDLGGTTHQLKGGVGYEFGEENLERLSNGWGNISVFSSYIRARYYFTQPAQVGQGTTWSAFVQDNITIASRLTANVGLLFDRDEFAQNLPGSGGCPTVAMQGGSAVYESSGDVCTFLRFPFGSEVQPRVGLTYNPRKDQSDKLYMNWGRYYAMDQKSSSRSLAPRRIYQYEARYDPVTGALISNLPRASTTGKMIDPDIKPTYSDEWLFGYATQIGRQWSFDTYLMYRNAHNFIEDMASSSTIYPVTGSYVAANMPCTNIAACVGAEAKRSYKAWAVEVTKRLSDGWSASFSYAWSEFKGNFDIDYGGGAIFNTSSIIQDGPGTFVQDPFRYGPLRQDRPHVFKAFGSWMPLDQLSLGGYFRAQSGAAYTIRGQDSQGGSALNYLLPAGSFRNPFWVNFDLLASYSIKIGSRAKATFEARVFNLFDTQTQLSSDSVQYLTLSSFTGLVIPYSANSSPNPTFNTANGYAPPRRLVLGAIFSF